MCPDLPGPTNGRVTFSTDSLAPFTLNTVATYSCDEGYGLSGGSTTRTCGPNAVNTDPEGTWSGSAPTCEGEYSMYVSTALHALHSNSLTQISAYSYTTAITCASLGTIADGEPITYDTSADAMGNFAFATVATHSCSDGFFLMGNEMRVCGGDGTSPTGMWSGSEPVCSGNHSCGNYKQSK